MYRSIHIYVKDTHFKVTILHIDNLQQGRQPVQQPRFGLTEDLKTFDSGFNLALNGGV